MTPTSSVSSARSTAARWRRLVRLFGDIDVAEEAVQDAFAIAVRAVARQRPAAEPGRLDHHDRPQPGDRPRCAARRRATTATPQARPGAHAPTNRTRWDRCTTTGCD